MTSEDALVQLFVRGTGRKRGIETIKEGEREREATEETKRGNIHTHTRERERS
jgi:hypothetical protein